MSAINWKVSKTDALKIAQIVTRAIEEYCKLDMDPPDRLSLQMDITAVHCNGCRLRLDDWLAADTFNFMHDIGGIQRHVDRDTGKLQGWFLPRFSKPRKSRKAGAA